MPSWQRTFGPSAERAAGGVRQPLTSKIAALYVQYFDDRIALQAVNEIENLTTGLSRKIWQKVMILDTLSSGSG